MLLVKNNLLCVRKCWMSWRKPQSFMSIIVFTSKVYLSGECCSKRQAEGRNIWICSQMSRDAWGLMWGCDKVAWASYDQVRGTIVAWECWQIPQTIPKKAALIMRWMSARCHVWGKSAALDDILPSQLTVFCSSSFTGLKSSHAGPKLLLRRLVLNLFSSKLYLQGPL